MHRAGRPRHRTRRRAGHRDGGGRPPARKHSRRFLTYTRPPQTSRPHSPPASQPSVNLLGIGEGTVLPAAVPDVNTGAVDQESVREFIQRLTDAAGNLPGGLDSAVELAICDGKDLQFITRVDVSVWTTVPDTGPLQSYVLIRPHDHPGDSPGPRTRGAPAPADAELRWLTERDDD